jgi:hypothetical protein
MLSNCRIRFLLLACCAFFALLCMGVSAAAGTRMSASFDATHASTTFAVDGVAHALDGGHANSPDPSPNDLVITASDSDADDDPAMPVSLNLRIDHSRYSTPAGVIPSLLVTPTAPLLRPPSPV